MIIFLGGFPGSNKRALVEKLSQKHDLYYHDLDRFMAQKQFFDMQMQFNKQAFYPRFDAERLLVYKKAAADLPMMSKLYENVIVSDSLHRKTPREYFFKEAKKYFDRIAIVWIEVSDEQARRVITEQYGKNETLGPLQVMRRRTRMQRVFEPFSYPVATFAYDDRDPDTAARLWELILTDAARKKSF
jgi:hypothetical protein